MWSAFSNVGDAALTLPVALVCASWLALSDWRLAIRWVSLLAAGMALVGLTKILYAGCGFEISQIDFRVISGHTMLSTAVWTVTVALLVREWRPNGFPELFVGLGIGLITGVARVFVHAHSISEVVIGWGVGTLVALLSLSEFRRAHLRLSGRIPAAVVLLLVSSVAYGHRAPFQDLIDKHSAELCARVSARLAAFF